MSYVPLYCTISDNCVDGVAHTSSRRGKVTRINGDVNSHFGEVFRFNVHSYGELPRKSEYEARQKISDWDLKGSVKRVALWQNKLKERIEYNLEQAKQESVDVNISTYEDSRFHYSIDSAKINKNALEILRLIQHKSWKSLLRKLKEDEGVDIMSLAVAKEV